MKKNVFALACIGLLPAWFAHADSSLDVRDLLPLSLEQLLDMNVSISTHSQQKMSKAPSVVSVITADDIKATGTTNLMDILQSVPGIYIRHNQFGYRPLVSMRGTAGTHTLLMINGAPQRDLVWSNGIFWKGLPASMVERIEIIRGPGSALFGSDASAGVINIITRTAGNIQSSAAGVRAGNFDSQAGWMRHGTQWNGFDINITAELSHTDGHRPYFAADRQSTQDDATGTMVSHAPRRADLGYDNQDFRFSIGQGNWRLLADYMSHRNLGIGLTGAGVLDPYSSARDQQASLALLYNNETFAKDWGLNAEVRYRDLDYSSGDGFNERPAGFRCTAPGNCFGAAPGTYANGLINQMQSAERRLNFEVSGLYTGFKNHSLRIGAGHVWQDIYQVKQSVNFWIGPDGNLLPANRPLVSLTDTPYAFAPEQDRKNSFAYLQDAWTFADDWELTAGARYDNYSDFGSTVNPRLALVWQTTNRLTTKLMYGEAFRAPSYLELYARTSATLPNPNLTPEESKTWDLSFAYAASRNLKLGVNLYHLALSNIIVPSAQYENGGNHVIRGIEMEAAWQATETLRFSGNLTHRRQDYSGLTSYGVPDEEAYLRADWAFMPQWTWNLQANWTGKREIKDNDTRTPPGSHTLSDTTIRYAHDKNWEFAASIRNLFDVDAKEYTSTTALRNYLPLPERNFYAEVRYKF